MNDLQLRFFITFFFFLDFQSSFKTKESNLQIVNVSYDCEKGFEGLVHFNDFFDILM